MKSNEISIRLIYRFEYISHCVSKIRYIYFKFHFIYLFRALYNSFFWWEIAVGSALGGIVQGFAASVGVVADAGGVTSFRCTLFLLYGFIQIILHTLNMFHARVRSILKNEDVVQLCGFSAYRSAASVKHLAFFCNA